jgi:hypothetical protein
MIPGYNRYLKTGKYQLYFLFLFSLLGIGLMVSLLLRSTGMPEDEIAHLNISRQAWNQPSLMLDTWGRPLNTIIYMLPAWHSRTAARFVSILLSTASLLLTVLTARKLHIKSSLFLIPVLLLFQPWYLRLGFTAITVVPFCLALVAGVYFWVSKKYNLASICLGSLVLIRHEGIVLVGAWCLWMLLKRKWTSLAVSLVPYALYNLLYVIVFGKPAVGIFLNIKPTDFYGSGSWFHYVKITLRETASLPVILSLFAIPAAIKLREKGMIFLLFALYFLTHTIIYRFGLFASGGYYLFLMPLATGFALAGALGVESVLAWIQAVGRKLGPVWSVKPAQGLLFLAICAGMLSAGLRTQPFIMSDEEAAVSMAAHYLETAGSLAENVYAANPVFHFIYRLPISNWLNKPDLMALPAGSIVVWDWHYSDRWGVRYDWLSGPSSPYEQRESFYNGQVIIFEKK